MTQKSPTILVRHTDHRTPLEKALGVDDSTTKDRFATPHDGSPQPHASGYVAT